MEILRKILIKFEGLPYHSMSRETRRRYKYSENESLTSPLLWGCSMLIVFDISMLVLVLSNIISNVPGNIRFLIPYHISILTVFSLAVILLSIMRTYSGIAWLRRTNISLLLSVFALLYTAAYTIHRINIDGQIVVYTIGLIFSVYFLRERPILTTAVYLSVLAALIVYAVIFAEDKNIMQSVIFFCSILTAFTIYISTSMFKHRLISFYTNEQLNKLVTTDPLTGLNNRFSYNEYIKNDNVICPAVICIFDMDNLKTVNDTLGHLEGDKCLKAVAKSLRTAFEFSFLARIGGDEFVVILCDTAFKTALPMIDRFRTTIAEEQNGIPGTSVSLGYCRIGKKSGIIEAYIKAENMMYEEKNKKKLPA